MKSTHWMAALLILASVVSASGFKVPSGLALVDEGRWLLVSLQRSGEVAMVRLADGAVTLQRVGMEAADLVAIDGERLLLSDPTEHEVRCLQFDPAGPKLEPVASLPDVGRAPWHLSVSAQRLALSDRDFRRPQILSLSLLGTNRSPRVSVRRSSPLFLSATGLIVPSPDRRRLRRFAPGKPMRILDVQASNIHSLAHDFADDTLLLTAARLSPVARTTIGDIHWGGLVEHQWLSVPLLEYEPLGRKLRRHRIGDIGNPGCDPAGVVVDGDGRMMIALAGSNEVLIEETRKAHAPIRIATGARPQHLLLDRERQRLFVANTLGDSVTVIELDDFSSRELALNPGAQLTARDRGERLFFDAKLSLEGWMSCHTCHAEGGSHGQLVDTLADGGYGSPKRIPSLHGVGETAPYGWNGSKSNLHTQVHDTLLQTMQHPGPPHQADIDDLVTYLESLPAPTPVPAADAELAERGRRIFLTRKCDKCHAPPAFTRAETYDIGLIDEHGKMRFNPPSLRGLLQRHALFHDGSGGSLGRLLGEQGHPGDGKPISDHDLRALIAYLNSL